MYVYGRAFTIKSDHKPLESISQKNLADTPAHLQCMLLHLQGYNYTIHYHPGKEIVLSNTLSQFSPCPGPVTSILATSGDLHHGRWPCPTWRSPHHPSVRTGEDTTAIPPVPSRNHLSPVVHVWMCLLAGHKQSHRRNSLAV